MNALKPRPAFQVLIMSEESRLGREAIETAYALKAFADELEREKARQRTYNQRRRRSRSPASTGDGRQSVATAEFVDRETLFARLVALEEQWEARQIGESRYRVEREALMRRLEKLDSAADSTAP